MPPAKVCVAAAEGTHSQPHSQALGYDAPFIWATSVARQATDTDKCLRWAGASGTNEICTFNLEESVARVRKQLRLK